MFAADFSRGPVVVVFYSGRGDEIEARLGDLREMLARRQIP